MLYYILFPADAKLMMDFTFYVATIIRKHNKTYIPYVDQVNYAAGGPF